MMNLLYKEIYSLLPQKERKYTLISIYYNLDDESSDPDHEKDRKEKGKKKSVYNQKETGREVLRGKGRNRRKNRTKEGENQLIFIL